MMETSKFNDVRCCSYVTVYCLAVSLEINWKIKTSGRWFLDGLWFMFEHCWDMNASFYEMRETLTSCRRNLKVCVLQNQALCEYVRHWKGEKLCIHNSAYWSKNVLTNAIWCYMMDLILEFVCCMPTVNKYLPAGVLVIISFNFTRNGAL